MKKFAYIFNSLLLALIIAGDVCYILYGEVWIKGITSGLFVLLAAVNLLLSVVLGQKHWKFSAFLLTGLIFAMLGDIFLNLTFANHFIVGAALFAVGHIFFFVAYCNLIPFRTQDLLMGAIIFIPSAAFIVMAPIFDFGEPLMEVVCIVYALIISFMLGKAFMNFIKHTNVLNIIVFIGSFLFFFSDLMLLLNMFGGLPHYIDILCLATYYPAEFLLAHSILAPALWGKKQK